MTDERQAGLRNNLNYRQLWNHEAEELFDALRDVTREWGAAQENAKFWKHQAECWKSISERGSDIPDAELEGFAVSMAIEKDPRTGEMKLVRETAACSECGRLREALDLAKILIRDIRHGFSPAVNPERWAEQALAGIAALASKPTPEKAESKAEPLVQPTSSESARIRERGESR